MMILQYITKIIQVKTKFKDKNKVRIVQRNKNLMNMKMITMSKTFTKIDT